MKKTLKKILIKLNLWEVQNEKVQTPIKFPGGLTPINKTNPEDVFIVGFPKSGNTLMQHIITHLVYGLNSEVTVSIPLLFVPDIYASTHYFRFNEVCYFKSHERPQPNYKKVIYLVRDGREALLSYYHMMKNMGKEISLEDLYHGKIDIYGGQWHEHLAEWEKNPYNAEILFVKYEDLITNKMSVLNQLCSFLNITRTSAELNEVIKLTSFEFMKTVEQKEDWQKIKINISFTKGNFVRKGAIDSYKEEIPKELLNTFIKNSKNNFYNFQTM